MIKRVSVDQLKPGMYIHDLNCGWLDHPFLTNAFAIKDEVTIQKIASLGIREVYIDTVKGVDVWEGRPQAEINADLERRLQEIAKKQAERPIVVDLKDEKVRALRLHSEANKVIRNLMEDARLGQAIVVERVEPTVDAVIESIFRNQDALLPLARLKKQDDYTFQHSVSVCALLVAFGRSMKLPRDAIHDLALGGMLHDIGKANIPDNIVNKPGKLSDAEFAEMKSHVNQGLALLADASSLRPITLEVVAQHHERLDGTGYPGGKAGEAFSLYGQMASIVDVYDAISSETTYHRGMSPTQALKKLLEWSDHHFDPKLVQAFVRSIGIYPSGTLVRLESNRIGVVVEQNEGKLLEPTVRVFYHAVQKHYIPPEVVDLSKTLDKVASFESYEKWNIDPAQWLPH